VATGDLPGKTPVERATDAEPPLERLPISFGERMLGLSLRSARRAETMGGEVTQRGMEQRFPGARAAGRITQVVVGRAERRAFGERAGDRRASGRTGCGEAESHWRSDTQIIDREHFPLARTA